MPELTERALEELALRFASQQGERLSIQPTALVLRPEDVALLALKHGVSPEAMLTLIREFVTAHAPVQ